MKLKTLILYCLAQGAIAGECPPVSRELTALIEANTNKVRGIEYCQYRTIKSSNRREVALYTVEGACFGAEGVKGTCGNGHARYLTGIDNGTALAPYEIDKTNSFMATNFEFKDEGILVSGLEYLSEDARCCPSKKAERLIMITPNGFELKK